MAEAAPQRQTPGQTPAPVGKKEDKKEEKPKTAIGETEILGMILVGALVLAAFTKIEPYVSAENVQITLQNVFSDIKSSYAWPFIQNIVVSYITLANILSLAFLAGLIFALIRVRQLQRTWHMLLYPEDEKPLEAEEKNERWRRVVDHISSDNPSDWRLAVLEADIILDELLDYLGYSGDTVGDKLKKIARGDFRTLDYAWEAHRIRNAIAHEGQEFVLTEREARRIIDLYETVFREFDFI